MTPNFIPPPSSVLVIQPAKLGDVLMSSAMLDDLRAAFPGAALDFMVGPAGAALLENNPNIRDRLIFTSNSVRDALAARRRHYDWIIDPRGTNGTVIVAAASGAPVRAGFAVRSPRHLAYTHRLPRHGRPPEYSALERRRLIGMLGVPTLTTGPRLYLTSDERTAAASKFESLELRAGDPVVGLTLAGGTPRREWLAEHWAAASLVLGANGASVLVFAGPGDEQRLSRFRAAGGTGTVVSSSLRELFALLTHCSVFVSCDSGPAHFAMALGVPTVTIYSRDHAALWNPGRPETIALSAPADRPCAQCDRYGRKSDHRIHDCVQSVTADEVVAAVQRAIESG